MWLRKEERCLSFDEIFKKGIGRFLESKKYEELGIDLIENTPKEITEVAMEMHASLNGTFRVSMEDEELQRKFWSLLPKSELHYYPIAARIGSSYLKNNQNLLQK